MALPVLEKTWVHNVNNFFLNDHSSGNQEIGGRNLFLIFHYLFTDMVFGDLGGDFADQGGNVSRYTLGVPGPSSSPQSEGPWTEFRRRLFLAADVGRTIFFAGATSPGNNGYFTVTSVDPSGLWCQFTNAGVVTESLPTTSSMVLHKGSFPTLPNGRTPWRVNYCCASAASGRGCGTEGDLINRFISEGDYDSNTSGNRSWVVYENEITGSQVLIYMETNSSANQWVHFEFYVHPQGGTDPYTGGDLTGTRPVPSPINNDWFLISDATNLWGDTSVVNREWFLHLQITDDGLDTNFWAGRDGTVFFNFMMRQPADVTDDTDGIPFDGDRSFMTWHNALFPATAPLFSVSHFNDISWFFAVLDPQGNYAGPQGPGPHLMRCYWASEFFISATSHQGALHKDDVVGSYMFWPIGLVGNNVSGGFDRGRVGRLPDIFVMNNNTDMPLVLGATFPGDGSRQFVKINDVVLPWNGEKYRKRDGD